MRFTNRVWSINISSLREPMLRNHSSAANARDAWPSVFHLHDLRFARAIDGDNEKIVVLRFRNDFVLRPAGSGDDLRYGVVIDRKSTRLNSSHVEISYAVFCLKKKIRIA